MHRLVPDWSGYAVKLLHEDAEFDLYRGRRLRDDASVLLRVPVGDEPAPSTLRRMQHEYALRNALDPVWAAQPIALQQHGRQTMLVLGDPGGEPLDELLKQPRDLQWRLRVAIAIAAAIGRLHARGLVHRDIKPAHVLVDAATAAAHLTGFGIAVSLQQGGIEAPAEAEVITGSPAYMAPEQTGYIDRPIDFRSDLYALGVTLYELMTGALPYSATDVMGWVHCHIAQHPQSPTAHAPDLPTPVASIVLKLLAKAQHDRYQSAAGVQADLERCLQQWQARRQVDDFPLGTQDTRSSLAISDKLYGRESEFSRLLNALDRAASGATPEPVLVSGYSGVGKSSLVHHLHKELSRVGGIYASGKADAYKREIPFGTLAQAFQMPVREILSQSEDQVTAWRHALREALGTGGQLVVNLLPELELIVGPQPPLPDIAPQDAQNLFHAVIRRFLRVFAQADHPLVLFLDDIQWLDAASLRLLESLVADADTKYLLLVGAYRDNEVDALHPLWQALHRLRAAGVTLHELVLAPLSADTLCELVADALDESSDRVRALAGLVHEKTGGNPFFAIQFLTNLMGEALLEFDARSARWEWDLARIRAKGFTDNVVEFMIAKLQRLPERTRAALKQISALGIGASLSTLTVVQGESEDQLLADLLPAVAEGLVVQDGASVRLLHDRIQEAAYALIPQTERAALHLGIGRLLWSRLDTPDATEGVFEVVSQLNRGAGRMSDEGERVRLAELNLNAGMRARQSGAYSAALSYFVAGSELVASDDDPRRHALHFALEFARAECEVLTGALGSAQQRLVSLAGRAISAPERAAVTCARMQLHQLLSQSERSTEIALEFMRGVGVHWSAHPTADDVAQEYERLWQQLGDRPVESLVDLPRMNDADQSAIMDVLMATQTAALFTDRNLFHLVIGRMVYLSLVNGNCDASCVGYVYLNTVIGREFGDYPLGFRFGQLALQLVERGFDRFKISVFVTFGWVVLPYTRHMRGGVEWIKRAFDLSEESGNMVYACYSAFLVAPLRLSAGDPLSEVRQETDFSLALARKAQFDLLIVSSTGYLRCLDRLCGVIGPSSADDHEQIEFEQKLDSEPQLAISASQYWIREVQTRFLAEDFHGALQAEAKAMALGWMILSAIEAPTVHTYGALARAALHGSMTEDDQRQCIERIRDDLLQLSAFAKNCPENFADQEALVAAELARLEGRAADAERLYERATHLARQSGFIHHEAVANELAARFYEGRGLETIAYALFRNARYGYQRWGALAKVRWLDMRYPFLRERQGIAAAGTIDTPVAQLNLAAVVRAAQAVSSEIVLDDLIETLLELAVQHAGAERGVLVLLHDGQPRIAAQADMAADKVQVTLRHANVTDAAVPLAAMQYVIRTRQDAALDDPDCAALFKTGDGAPGEEIRSAICLPLVKQAKLLGVLYLENRRAPSKLTGARRDLLNVIASQAAISLENADLYSNLAAENRERKRAEEALRQSLQRIQRLVESNIIGVIFWHADGRIEDANDSFLDMLGYTRDELQSGNLRWDDLTPSGHEAADARSMQEIRDAGTCRPYEKEYLHRDGHRVPVLVGAASLDGTQESGVAYVLDLTERKRAEVERRAREAAEAASRAKGEFLASVSHEIRTPMNAIMGMSYLALQGNLEARQRRYIQTVHESAESLLSIINDILDFSKIEAGRLDMESIEFNLSDVMDSLIGLVGMKAQEKQLELLFDQSPQVPVELVGDPSRLRQVLVNLANNAIKFTERGEVVIGVELLSRDEKSAWLRFEVRDTGVGMSAEQQRQLFQAFSQGDASISRRYGGTGLGLAICRRLVGLMGGEIEVDSQPGAGSRFRFTVHLGLQAHPANARAIEDNALAGTRILVVDDNETARKILVSMLASLGCACDATGDGAQALQMLAHARSRHDYDTILIDSKMPLMDGIECAREIARGGHERLPIVMMVAGFDRDILEQRLGEQHMSVAALLTKPVTPSNLLDACRTALGRLGLSATRRTIREDAMKDHQANLRGARILLAEDNAINQEVVCDVLERAGLHVTVVENGQEAIDILDRETFDGVLMDCQMPVVDGYTATMKVRETERLRDLPIIAMTASAMAGDRERALAAGMNDHISKPLNVDDLFATLARWVRPARGTEAGESPRDAAPSALNVLPGIDPEEWRKRGMGDDAMYRRMLKKFLQAQQDFPALFLQALAAGDLLAARRLAHTLKSLAGMLGAQGVERAAESLEQGCIDGLAIQHLEALLKDVSRELEPVLKGLRTLDSLS